MTAPSETSETIDPRRVSLYAGHFDALWGLAWSPDGTRILSGSHDGTARVWDADSGGELFALTGRGGSVNAAAWSPDGRRLATTSEEHTARIWDADTGEDLLLLDLGGQAIGGAVAWSPDSTRLITRMEDDAARIWDAATGETVRTLVGHADNVTAVAWSPDRTRVATASDDGTARIWDVTTGTELLHVGPIPVQDTAQGEDGAVEPMTGLAWSPDSTRIITASDESMPRVWDAATGAHLLTLSGEYWVSTVAWSPDSTRIVTDDLGDSSAHVWDANTGVELMTLAGHGKWACSLAWSPDSTRVATGSHDHTVRIWDPVTGECVKVLGPGNSVDAVAWSPEGSRVVVGAKIGGTRVWDLTSGEPVLTVDVQDPELSSFGWSPDGSRLAADSYFSRGVSVLNASTGEGILSLTAGLDEVNAFAWSPEGRRLLTGVGSSMAVIWDADRGTALLELEGHSDIVTSVAWSPNGARALTGSQDGSARIWDTTTGKVVRTFTHDWVREVAWTRGGPRVVTGSADGDGHVWDAITGGELVRLAGQGAMVRSFAWSPDGQRVLAGFDDGVARVWDEVSGKVVLTLAGHRFGVTAAQWSPDGARIITGSEDATVRLWDAQTGEMTGPFFCFLPDGEVAVLDAPTLGLRAGSEQVWDLLARPEVIEGRLTRVLMTPRSAEPLPFQAPAEEAHEADQGAGAEPGTAQAADQGAPGPEASPEGLGDGHAAEHGRHALPAQEEAVDHPEPAEPVAGSEPAPPAGGAEPGVQDGAPQSAEPSADPVPALSLVADDSSGQGQAPSPWDILPAVEADTPEGDEMPDLALLSGQAHVSAPVGQVRRGAHAADPAAPVEPGPEPRVPAEPQGQVPVIPGTPQAPEAPGAVDPSGMAATAPGAVPSQPAQHLAPEVQPEAQPQAPVEAPVGERPEPGAGAAAPQEEAAPQPWGDPELRRRIYTEVEEFVSAIARRDLNELASRYGISGDSLSALEEQIDRFPVPASELSLYPIQKADEYADGRHRLTLSELPDSGVLIESEVWREGTYAGGLLVAHWNPMGIYPFDFRSFRF
ncbi:MAG: hypothetical protein Q4E00_02770 [Actinomyces bowdenii]|nr:hypothetical protein [Actinomyces bowdenii]